LRQAPLAAVVQHVPRCTHVVEVVLSPSTRAHSMDGFRRWPGWFGHVVEHHLALLQQRWLRNDAALGDPLLRAFPIGLTLVLTMWWARLLLVHLWRLATRLSGWFMAVGAAFYVLQLESKAWLRQEWWDFLRLPFYRRRVACAICAEEVCDSPWHFLVLPCCSGKLCWSCLRRYAEGVIDDARPEMRCPLVPCRRILPDMLVFIAIRREQWSLANLELTGRVARRKWRSYEQWVRQCGLAESCAARNEDVLHCPSADCGHMWVVPRELRRQKGRGEPRSLWDPRSWSIVRHAGFYEAPADDGEDLRKLSCPKCKGVHCLLCGRPWIAASGDSHYGRSCVEHGGRLGERRAERRWAGAKACPGCGVRIIRSMGCNHMSCTQCHYEWCWVCRAKWNGRHYSCAAAAEGQQECAVL